jgi:two-component system CheB/CheR fusion protein
MAVDKCPVLVVDDDRDAADTLATLIRLWGHEAHVAYSAPDALDAIAKFRPQVMLVDLLMPGTDGYELAREIRRGSDIDSVVLVAVSGFADDRHKKEAYRSGFDAYLVKPVAPSDMETILGSVFSKASIS